MLNWLVTFLADVKTLDAYTSFITDPTFDPFRHDLGEVVQNIVRVCRGMLALVSPLPNIYSVSSADVDYILCVKRRGTTGLTLMSDLSANARTLQQVLRGPVWLPFVTAYKEAQATELVKGPQFWQVVEDLKPLLKGAKDPINDETKRQVILANALSSLPEFQGLRPGATNGMRHDICEVLSIDIEKAKQLDSTLKTVEAMEALGAMLDMVGTRESEEMRQGVNEYLASIAQAGRQEALDTALAGRLTTDANALGLLNALKGMKGQKLRVDQSQLLADCIPLVWKAMGNILRGCVMETSLASCVAFLQYVAQSKELTESIGKPVDDPFHVAPLAIATSILDLKVLTNRVKEMINLNKASDDLEPVVLNLLAARDRYVKIKDRAPLSVNVWLLRSRDT